MALRCHQPEVRVFCFPQKWRLVRKENMKMKIVDFTLLKEAESICV